MCCSPYSVYGRSYLSPYNDASSGSSGAVQLIKFEATYRGTTTTIPKSTMVVPFAVYKTSNQTYTHALFYRDSPFILPGKTFEGSIVSAGSSSYGDTVEITFGSNQVEVYATMDANTTYEIYAMIVIA